MSHIMTALAMRQEGLKPASKIVLYWIADHHNGETGQCNPSINRLAKCCEMSRRSVEAHIKTLQEAGLIKVCNKFREAGGKTSNLYTLCMAESDAQNLRMGGAKSAHGDAQNLRMKNLGNNNLGMEPVLGLALPDPEPPNPKSRLPQDWVPDDEMIAYAYSKQLTDDEIKEIANDFLIYWTDQPKAKSTKSLNGWRATWRNNINRIGWQYIKNRRTSGARSGIGSGTVDAFASVAADMLGRQGEGR